MLNYNGLSKKGAIWESPDFVLEVSHQKGEFGLQSFVQNVNKDSKHVFIQFLLCRPYSPVSLTFRSLTFFPNPIGSPSRQSPLRCGTQDLIHYPRYGCPSTEHSELIDASFLETIILCTQPKTSFLLFLSAMLTFLIHILS